MTLTHPCSAEAHSQSVSAEDDLYSNEASLPHDKEGAMSSLQTQQLNRISGLIPCQTCCIYDNERLKMKAVEMDNNSPTRLRA
jgi:hypothetical protein